MPSAITINLRNDSLTSQEFFFFQRPSNFSAGQKVFTNSLYTQGLLRHSTSGSVLTFSLLLEFNAGVQEQVVAPAWDQPSGRFGAIRTIGLTPPPGGMETHNSTTMSVEPSLGLSVPTYTLGLEVGSFRIVTPPFNPILVNYNAGPAVKTISGGIILSNYVAVPPNAKLDCSPFLVFYVAIGNYPPGTSIDFVSSSTGAAVCDVTPGYSSFDVHYNPDGTWTVKPFALDRVAGP
jgi:hypothetical protein